MTTGVQRIRSGWSMRLKLGLVVLALVTSSAALAVGIGYGHVRAEGTAQIEREFQARAHEQALELERSVRVAQSALAGLAQDRVLTVPMTALERGTLDALDVRRGLWAPLAAALSHGGGFVAIGVADGSGQVLASTDADWIGLRVDELGPPALDAVPVRAFQGRTGRVALLQAPFHGLPGGVCALVDLESALRVGVDACGYPRPTLLAAPEPLGGEPALQACALQAVRGASGFDRVVDAQGEALLAVHEPIGAFGWGLVVHAREVDAFGALDRLRVGSLWILGAVLTAGILASLLLAQHFALPIRELARAANRVSAGDLTVRVVTDRRDELGELSAAFNRMTNELERSYATLERRVRERTQELEAVNAEMASFSYAMAHDVRAPLRSIAGFADLLSQKKGTELDAQGREMLERLRYNVERLFRLIEDLLAFSGISNQELRIESVDLARIVRDAIDDFADETRGRRVEFEVRELPPCRADSALLSLVFSNLISNAIKFTRPRELARIVVGAERRGDQVAYFVRDNGVGFDTEQAGKLFLLFQRLHAREEFDGTGLGLAIARRVVERHGGQIWAEAQPTGGACFYFTLPHAPSVRSERGVGARGVSAA
ncbi:MAG: HAMP domain-containing protein [Planctomycetes bacterium]|nr:HAMP domain-containing protein [Planctomycetota bacterium]